MLPGVSCTLLIPLLLYRVCYQKYQLYLQSFLTSNQDPYTIHSVTHTFRICQNSHFDILVFSQQTISSHSQTLWTRYLQCWPNPVQEDKSEVKGVAYCVCIDQSPSTLEAIICKCITHMHCFLFCAVLVYINYDSQPLRQQHMTDLMKYVYL